MSLLSELTAIAKEQKIPVETGVFSGTAPDTYIVLTPISDGLRLMADNAPGFEIHEVRVSLFCKGNYTAYKKTLTKAFLDADITISDRRYVGHEDDTEYHHYAIDVAKLYELEV